MIDLIGGLENSDHPEKKQKINQAFKLVVHQLKKLSSSWKNILSKEEYFQWIGFLQNQTFGIILDQLSTSLEDVGEEESNVLYQLLSDFQCECGKTIFQEFFQSSSASDNNSSGLFSPSLYVPLWQKFQDIASIFKLSLSQMVENYLENKLRSIPPSEIRRWICALFKDTPFRSAQLARLPS